jgi:hypothetical protein
MLKFVDDTLNQLKHIAKEVQDKKLQRMQLDQNQTVLQDVIKVLDVPDQATRLLSADKALPFILWLPPSVVRSRPPFLAKR